MEYTKLKCINQYKSKSINPTKTPDTVFEMYSVPIYETGHPEYLRGDEIASNKAVVQKNDILLCKINPRINRVWVVSDESDKMNIASSEWIVIRNSEYNPEFLAWYFRSPKFQKLMTSEVTGIGGSLTRAQPKCVAEYPVPVLDRVKQDGIVNILNKCKFVIESRKQELTALDDFIKARFVEMFGSIKEVHLLGDISEFVTVGIANSATHAYAESGIPMLRNQNIKENYLDDTDMIYIKPEFATQYESKKLKENDIIAMRTGYPGIACLVPKKYEGCQTFTTLIVRLKEDNNPSYVCSYINSDWGKRFIDSEKVGVAQQNVGAKSLAKMPIKIAPKQLQDEYSDFVRQVDKSKFGDTTTKTNFLVY